jgi:hypothetical protein
MQRWLSSDNTLPFCAVTPPAGGALSTNQSVTVELQDVIVQGNQVFGPFGQGGSAFINAGGVLLINSVRFMRGNSAEFGGAVAALDAHVTVSSSNISDNMAMQYDGGAVYAVSTSNTTLRFYESALSNNRQVLCVPISTLLR